jgi:hypothetical protein
MRRHKIIVFSAFLALLSSAPILKAQIRSSIEATIHHKFTIVNTTLPPGKYVFRMMSGTDMTVMTVTSENGNTAVEFLVNQSYSPTVPQHSELVFNRYDHREILEKIYQGGSRLGVAVAEPSRAELREQEKGVHPVTHTEPQ